MSTRGTAPALWERLRAVRPMPHDRAADAPFGPFQRGLYRLALISRLIPGSRCFKGGNRRLGRGRRRSFLGRAQASRLALLLLLFASLSGQLFLLFCVMVIRFWHVRSVSLKWRPR